jgi:hypothetical protein
VRRFLEKYGQVRRYLLYSLSKEQNGITNP